MSGNAGLGTVTNKNVPIDTFRTTSSYMEAISHSNQTDWWLLDFEEGSNLVYKYLIDSVGPRLHSEQSIGTLQPYGWCGVAGQSCFSPDGTLFTRYCSYTGLDVFDFDRSTGQLSNFRHLDIDTEYGVAGLSISPNSQFAYISVVDSLWQVDLTQPNLEDGLEFIADWDGFIDPFPVTFGVHQIGPDCRIYISGQSSAAYLHVITYPDRKGAACGFVQHGVHLPYQNSLLCIPNFPHFRVDEAEVCDSTITAVFSHVVDIVSGLKLYPNPATDAITITLPSEVVSSRIAITDLDGRVWHSADIVSDTDIVLDTYTYPRGVYIVTITTDDGRRYAERVVLM